MSKDIFSKRNIKPMLIGAEAEPFDSEDYIYELKLDGERCLAYLDKDNADLRNKRGIEMLSKVPELVNIYKQAKAPCILDGELIVISEGKPDFSEIQRRSMMSNKFKIELAAAKHPANYVAFDILYYQGEELTDLPLMERKKILEQVVRENERIAVSRYIEKEGKQFYQLAKEQELEGIVAKRKDSRYSYGSRTKEWLKIKYLQDDDYVICGYIPKEGVVASLVLGQYSGDELVYRGHVTLGVSSDAMSKIKEVKTITEPIFATVPDNHEQAVWLSPQIVCTVKYMTKSKSGAMRQPVFKGLREDKLPSECVVG